MFYGVILESARDGVIVFYGDTVWKRIVNELKLPSETFELFVRYDHKILLDICECKYISNFSSVTSLVLIMTGMAFILQEGTGETYLEFFGRDFVRYFINFGFEKILRVAGRTLRDFLFAIDQLHDSKRFTFPEMYQPLFHVTEENETGAALVYK
jgi:guanylate cyclase